MGGTVMLTGHRTWIFDQKPVIISTGTVVGPFEAKGNIPQDFDLIHGEIWLNQDSFEKAHQVMLEEACQKAIEKANLQKDQIQFFLGGDLINQITPTSFATWLIRSLFNLNGRPSTVSLYRKL